MGLEEKFTELYRPRTLEGVVLPKRIREEIGDGALTQDFLFYSTKPGTGKTTLSKALAKGYNTLYINVSDESSVEVLRGKVMNFAESLSLTDDGGYSSKVVIFDEIDGASGQFFAALRGIMENTSNLRFIATCNYINKVPDPLLSRFYTINFEHQGEEEIKEVLTGYVKRVLGILKTNEIEIDTKVAVHFVKKNFPDMRMMLNKIQRFANTGKKNITMEDFSTLNYLFEDVFELCITESSPLQNYEYLMGRYSGRVDDILYSLGDEFIQWLKDKNEPKYLKRIPQILAIAVEYQYKRTFVIDQNILMLACIFEIQSLFNTP